MKRQNKKTFFSLYKRHPLSNPYFPRIERKRSWKKLIISALLVIILAAGFVFLSPIFVIKQITAEGTLRLPSEALEKSAGDALSGRRYVFLYNKNAISQKLKTEYPIEEIMFRVKFPDRLFIIVKERLPILLLRHGEKTYLADKHGTMMAMEDGVEIYELFAVDLGEAPTARAGDSVFAEIDAQDLISVRDSILKETSLKIISARIESADSSSVEYATGEGWRIIFDFKKDTAAQLAKFYAVLQNELQNREGLQYVDVRFEDRVYYK